MQYRPKIIKGTVKGTGWPIDGHTLYFSQWDYDNRESWHLYGWDEPDDESVMQTTYQTETAAGLCLYDTLEGFTEAWKAKKWEPQGAFCLTLEQVDAEAMEMLVLPGGLGGVEALWADDRVSTLIQEAAGKGVWLAALCAGPVLLARWGLLDGRKAPSYPPRHDQLGKAEVLPQERAVADGKFVTGHACGSSFDFGLKLVEVLRGKEVADEINGRIFYYR